MINSIAETKDLHNETRVEFKCNYCNKTTNVTVFFLKKRNELICTECMKKRNNLAKYGVTNTYNMKKVKDKMIEKYGVDNVWKLKETQENIKKTNLKKYGVEHPAQSKLVLDKMKKTNLERYGIETYNNVKKAKETNLERYGLENTFQLEKSKETLMKNHGVNNPFKLREKIKRTNLGRYGVEHPLQNKEILKKVERTNLERYGATNFFKVENFKLSLANRKKSLFFDKLINSDRLKKLVTAEFEESEYLNKNSKNNTLKWKCNLCNKEFYSKVSNIVPRCLDCFPDLRDGMNSKSKFYSILVHSDRLKNLVTPLFIKEEYLKTNSGDKSLKWKCNKCSEEFESNIDDGKIPRCLKCFPILNGFSKQEKEVADYVKSLGLEIVENDRLLISPLEVDIYIPSRKLGIEFNGTYWHSSERSDSKWYHQIKVELCYRLGIRLLHIYEWEWTSNKQSCIDKIDYYLNCNDSILVRKPVARFVNKGVEVEFNNFEYLIWD